MRLNRPQTPLSSLMVLPHNLLAMQLLSTISPEIDFADLYGCWQSLNKTYGVGIKVAYEVPSLYPVVCFSDSDCWLLIIHRLVVVVLQVNCLSRIGVAGAERYRFSGRLLVVCN